MKNIITAILILGCGFGYAQATNMIPVGHNQIGHNINTTSPPNLSWVVGEFKIQSIKDNKAVLVPTFVGILPSVEAKFTNDCMNQYKFKQGDTLTFVIRDGFISQVFKK